MFGSKKKEELSFREQSENAISVFTTTLESLKNVNEKIFGKNKVIRAEIELKESIFADNEKTAKNNESIINKIETILN